MSPEFVIGIIAGLVVVIALLLLLRGRKKRAGDATSTEAVPAKQEAPPPVVQPERETPEPEAAAPDAPPVEELPAEEPPEGVRLDEREEAEAAARLEQERRDRKIKRLQRGLAPTRGGLIAKLGALFKGKKEIDPSLLEDLEDTLIMSDVGSSTAGMLLDILRDALDRDELRDSDAIWELSPDVYAFQIEQRIDHARDPAVPVQALRLVVTVHVQFDGLDQAGDLFFSDFHRPANG